MNEQDSKQIQEALKGVAVAGQNLFDAVHILVKCKQAVNLSQEMKDQLELVAQASLDAKQSAGLAIVELEMKRILENA